MTRAFHLPDLGEGVHEGQVVRLLVREGETIRLDQPLMEVETDKAAVEIPSPFAGVIEKVHVAAGQVVNVGELLVTIREGAAARSSPLPAGEASGVRASARESSRARTATPETKASPQPSALERASQAALGPATVAPPRRTPASPAVRALARRHGINLDSIRGSGPAGRITRADVEAAGRSPLPRAAPVTRASQPAASRSLAGIAQAMQGTNERDAWGPTRREPLTRIRRTIAEAMVRSASTIPHVTDTDDADVTELDRLRKGYHSDEKPDRRLTLLPFAVRAVAMALKKYPILNASLDETAAGGEPTITHHDYISIAVGVQTERGLIAPVIREADRLSVVQIADALADLAGKARNASFEVNDTRGGTFTISNAGAMGGSRYSTPIINPPQSAVLALGRARWMAWVVGGPGGMIAPRLILPLSLSFDHRIIDGGVSVPFLQEIIAVLESPARLML